MSRIKKLLDEDWEREHLKDAMYLDDEYRAAEEWQQWEEEEEKKKRLPAIIEIHYGNIKENRLEPSKKSEE